MGFVLNIGAASIIILKLPDLCVLATVMALISKVTGRFLVNFGNNTTISVRPVIRDAENPPVKVDQGVATGILACLFIKGQSVRRASSWWEMLRLWLKGLE